MAAFDDFGEVFINEAASHLDEVNFTTSGGSIAQAAAAGSGQSYSSKVSTVSSSTLTSRKYQQQRRLMSGSNGPAMSELLGVPNQTASKTLDLLNSRSNKDKENSTVRQKDIQKDIKKSNGSAGNLEAKKFIQPGVESILLGVGRVMQAMCVWAALTIAEYHFEGFQLKMRFGLVFLLFQLIFRFRWINMKQYLGSVFYLTIWAPIGVWVYLKLQFLHLPFVVAALGMTYLHIFYHVILNDFMFSLVLSTWILCADVVSNPKLQYHVADGDVFASVFLLATLSYAFFAGNLQQVVEFRNYHIILSHAREVYSEIRILPSVVRFLKRANFNGNQKKSKISAVGTNSKASKQNLSRTGTWQKNSRLITFLLNFFVAKEPTSDMPKIDQQNRKETSLSIPLDQNMVLCTDASRKENRFECCVERVEHDKVVVSWSTPRSLLMSLADKDSLRARLSVHVQLFSKHFLPWRHDSAFLDQREEELLNQDGNVKHYFTEIEGQFMLESSEIKVAINGVLWKNVDVKMDRKSCVISGLTAGSPYTIQTFIRDFSSIPIQVTTSNQEVPPLEQLSQKDREEFQKSWNRRSELISSIDDERQRKKDLNLVLKKLKKDHARLLAQAKQELEAARKLVQRDENVHQRTVQRCTTIQDTVRGLKKQLESTKDELDKCLQNVYSQRQLLQGGVCSEHAQQQQRLETAQERLQTQSHKHNSILKKLQLTLQDKSRSAQILQQELDAVDSEKKLAIMKLSEFDENVKSLKRQRFILEKESTKQEQALSNETQYKTTIAHIQEEVDMLREERDQLLQQFQRMESELLAGAQFSHS